MKDFKQNETLKDDSIWKKGRDYILAKNAGCIGCLVIVVIILIIVLILPLFNYLFSSF